MFFYVTTKKNIGKIFAITVLSCLVVYCMLWQLVTANKAAELPKNALDYNSRVEFVSGLGYSVDKTEKEKSSQVEIPHIFPEIYEEYNGIQKAAGYDLHKFSGKKVTLYVLKINYPQRDDVYANLLVYDGSIIGGDITALSVSDGFMLPLIVNNKNGS